MPGLFQFLKCKEKDWERVDENVAISSESHREKPLSLQSNEIRTNHASISYLYISVFLFSCLSVHSLWDSLSNKA